jgi:hypothetical protein
LLLLTVQDWNRLFLLAWLLLLCERLFLLLLRLCWHLIRLQNAFSLLWRYKISWHLLLHRFDWLYALRAGHAWVKNVALKVHVWAEPRSNPSRREELSILHDQEVVLGFLDTFLGSVVDGDLRADDWQTHLIRDQVTVAG